MTLASWELKRSSLVAGLDVLLFSTTSIVAARYWLETKNRMRELQRLRVDVDTLAFRGLFLLLLSIANALRAVGIIFDARIAIVLHRQPHTSHWRHYIDYFSSSLPTLVWISMLSVLLLYIIEIYHRSRLRRAPLLRSTFVFLNAIFYILYGTIAIVTMRLQRLKPTCNDFRRFAYFLLAIAHLLVATGLLWYGWALTLQLRRRTELSCAQAAVAPSQRISILIGLIPVVELVRVHNDFEYSTGGWLFTLDSGIFFVFVEFARLILEWVPSAAILLAFRPRPVAETERRAALDTASSMVGAEGAAACATASAAAPLLAMSGASLSSSEALRPGNW